MESFTIKVHQGYRCNIDVHRTKGHHYKTKGLLLRFMVIVEVMLN